MHRIFLWYSALVLCFMVLLCVSCLPACLCTLSAEAYASARQQTLWLISQKKQRKSSIPPAALLDAVQDPPLSPSLRVRTAQRPRPQQGKTFLHIWWTDNGVPPSVHLTRHGHGLSLSLSLFLSHTPTCTRMHTFVHSGWCRQRKISGEAN